MPNAAHPRDPSRALDLLRDGLQSVGIAVDRHDGREPVRQRLKADGPADAAPVEAEAPVMRPVPASVAAAAEPAGTKSRPAVRAVPAAPKVATVSPMHFNDVQEIADRFKQSQPVIMNLRGAEKPLARRLLDFSSGICYALGGTMEKVATQVYLLTPEGVEVTDDDKRRMYERGLFG